MEEERAMIRSPEWQMRHSWGGIALQPGSVDTHPVYATCHCIRGLTIVGPSVRVTPIANIRKRTL